MVEDLRNQLQVYSSKFELFQSTLAKSNPVFLTYKLEMDKVCGARSFVTSGFPAKRVDCTEQMF